MFLLDSTVTFNQYLKYEKFDVDFMFNMMYGYAFSFSFYLIFLQLFKPGLKIIHVFGKDKYYNVC